MNISMPVFTGKSGADIFTQNLADILKIRGCDVEIKKFTAPVCFSQTLSTKQYNPEGFDLTHANSWHGFAFKRDIPLVVTEHTAIHDPSILKYKTIGQRIFHQYLKKKEIQTFKVSDAIVCVSHYCRKIVEKEFQVDNSQVIYNGIDPAIYKKKNTPIDMPSYGDKKLTLFYAGNHTRMKGFDQILKIGERLKEKATIFVSSGFKQNLVQKITSNIISIGTISQEQMVKQYNDCDIYLFPSRMEGFGLTVAEAMACEKPVIATNYASFPELIDDGKGGFLCTLDDINDFVTQIEYLSEDDELRHHMGVYNRQKVLSQFSLSRMTDEYIHLYQNLIE